MIFSNLAIMGIKGIFFNLKDFTAITGHLRSARE